MDVTCLSPLNALRVRSTDFICSVFVFLFCMMQFLFYEFQGLYLLSLKVHSKDNLSCDIILWYPLICLLYTKIHSNKEEEAWVIKVRRGFDKNCQN